MWLVGVRTLPRGRGSVGVVGEVGLEGEVGVVGGAVVQHL